MSSEAGPLDTEDATAEVSPIKDCRQCWRYVDEVQDALECPVAQKITGGSRPNSITNRAAWFLLRYGTDFGQFTPGLATGALIDGPLWVDDTATRTSRVHSGLRKIKSALGPGVITIDAERTPTRCDIDATELIKLCVADDVDFKPEESSEDPDEPTIDPRQFKKLKVLPGLAQVTLNYILSEYVDADTEDERLELFSATVMEACKGTRRSALVDASLKVATASCVSYANIKRYGRTRGAKERFAKVSLISEKLV